MHYIIIMDLFFTELSNVSLYRKQEQFSQYEFHIYFYYCSIYITVYIV